MTKSKEKNISLMRPLLPTHSKIDPYLKTIDKNRWYSNFGPLAFHLEERLCEFFSVPSGGVVTVSNGTSGLTNTLRAFNLPADSYCFVPSWTFVATAAAAVTAGLIPYFLDVDEETWALTPEIVKEQIKKVNGKVGAVITVAPFGEPFNSQEWDDFTKQTGIPVIIDAAAAFDAVSHDKNSKPGNTPVMVSMHATKVCGCGEGGVVVSKNTSLIRKVREISNFGFAGKRIISIVGTNDKMSEYTAAVAHAALDNWPEKRADWISLNKRYLKAFAKSGKGIKKIWLTEKWATSTLNIQLHSSTAEYVIEKLKERGIDSRKWWLNGCHTHPAYNKFPKGKLIVTDKLGKSVLAIPFYIDIKDSEINYVVNSLQEILGNSEVEEVA